MNGIMTKSGQVGSLQIAYLEDIATVPFKLKSGFLIKNLSDEVVELEVNMLGMEEDIYITTSFEPGWNPENIREIRSGDISNIQIGY